MELIKNNIKYSINCCICNATHILEIHEFKIDYSISWSETNTFPYTVYTETPIAYIDCLACKTKLYINDSNLVFKIYMFNKNK